MPNLSVIAGLTTALCWGTGDYLSRSQSERMGYYKTLTYSMIVTFLVLVALTPVVSPELSAPLIPLVVLLVAGVLNFVAFNFLYQAFHRGVVSVVAPVAYTYPAITTLLSIFILGTVLQSAEILAIAGIIIGVVLTSTRFSEIKRSTIGKGSAGLTAGFIPAAAASLFFGFVYVGVGYAAPLVSLVIPVMILRIVGIAMGLALAPALKQSARPTKGVFSSGIITMGILEAVGFLSLTYGISVPGGSLPVVTAISGMGGAVAAGYGLVLLKERLEPNQIIGVVMSLLGVFALLYLGA
ncbi:MAG: EamA family transporter [Nitrososphaerota archaeon]|nr:EamA family transporter [Nitrososphaerota archaeon]MDG6945365.1 EamA family transporter [Nitrososphaerota archaeon]MDG6949107.1 EamA family transporter [Nitrososphaerota archaeon]